MQFLGPALNGMKAKGCNLFKFSTENRSGLNSLGFLKYFSNLWVVYGAISTLQPAGSVCSPVNKKH